MIDRLLLVAQTLATLLFSWPGLTVAALVVGALWVASLHRLDDDDSTPPTAPGATHGPWATHPAHCRCSACR